MSNIKARELLKSADILMGHDDIDKAKHLIEQAISLRPIKYSVFADAVNILLNRELYSDAKNIFEIYQKETGKNLRADFTYDDISKMEKNSILGADGIGESFQFRRLSLKERGHFSNLFSLRPIKEIEISNNGISLTQCRTKQTFNWNEITKAYIIKRYRFKSYGRAAGAYIVQKIFFINVSNKIFKFDVSTNFPDFKYNAQLVRLLMKYLRVEIVDKMKS